MKTYVLFGNDHSASMENLRKAALNDYNANSGAIKEAATREMQDTIVSAIAFGRGRGTVERDIVCSNPHVLKPMASWAATGNTPLWDAVGDAIALMKSVPDYTNPNVSFLLMFTTDGEEYGSTKETKASIARKIAELNREERWTIVFRVPKGQRGTVSGLGLPEGNIQEWETTVEGMAKSTAATQQAVNQFYATRSAGGRSSSSFYANAANVDTSKLKDISKAISLYVVESWENGKQIRDFILNRRQKYLKGSAFYQLTKTEPRVGPNKMLAIRERATGKVFAGAEARTMLGLSSVNNIRLHPGDHGNYDLFIQSESVNRKLVAGTGVLYWEEIGVEFTQEEITRYTTPAAPKPVVPQVVQLPQVAPTNRPTPSPLKPTPKVAPVAPVAVPPATPVLANAVKPVAKAPGAGETRVRYHYPTANALYFSTRDIAREAAHQMPGKKQYDAGPTAQYGRRFFVDAA